MPQLAIMSVFAVGSATAFGYLGGAAMETGTGRILLGVLAALVGMIAIVETMRMAHTARRV